MTARNLKIRITVGPEDTRRPRRTVATPTTKVPPQLAPARTTGAATKAGSKTPAWLIPVLAVAAVATGLAYFLAGPDEPGTRQTTADVGGSTVEQAEVAAPTSGVSPQGLAEVEAAVRRAAEAAVAQQDAARPATPTSASPQAAPTTPAPQIQDDSASPEAVTLPALSTNSAIGAPPAEAQLSAIPAQPESPSGEQPPAATTTTVLAPVAPTAASETQRAALPTSDKVARAVFTSGIARLEPADDLGSTLEPKGEVTRLYFFTELRELSGQRVRHRWLLDGRRIMDIPIDVRSARYRASSNARLSSNRQGIWEVQVLDSKGQVLHASQIEYR